MEGLGVEGRQALVFLGVGTHSEAHVAVALDGTGRRIGELSWVGCSSSATRLRPGWRARAATGPDCLAS